MDGRERRRRKEPAMRRIALLLVLVMAAIPAATASADSPNFKSATASGPDANGNVTVNFRETGLGNTGDPVDYTATADANALYACQNNGGNFPSDPKKQTATGPVSSSGTFPSGKNGNVTGSLTLRPPASTLRCPGGQHAVLANVTYTNVQICDTDHNVCASIPGTFSRVFFIV
jgi:hypothetical protein